MKMITLVPAVFVVFTGAAFVQAAGDDAVHPNFALADTDKDGLLSISEVQAALPDVEIKDENADGFVNQSEAESAVAGLAFESNGYTGGSSLVSEPEYGLIVSSLDEDDAADGAGIVDDNTDGPEGARAENRN